MLFNHRLFVPVCRIDQISLDAFWSLQSPSLRINPTFYNCVRTHVACVITCIKFYFNAELREFRGSSIKMYISFMAINPKHYLAVV